MNVCHVINEENNNVVTFRTQMSKTFTIYILRTHLISTQSYRCKFFVSHINNCIITNNICFNIVNIL